MISKKTLLSFYGILLKENYCIKDIVISREII